jgi:hypothetical protein
VHFFFMDYERRNIRAVWVRLGVQRRNALDGAKTSMELMIPASLMIQPKGVQSRNDYYSIPMQRASRITDGTFRLPTEIRLCVCD